MRKAFTLVELLIVIAILAVLAVVVFVVINPAQRITAAQTATLENNTQTIQNAFELYAIDNSGQYPELDNQTGGNLPIPTHDEPPSPTDCSRDINNGSLPHRSLDYFDESLIPDYLPKKQIDSPFSGWWGHYTIYLYTPTNQIVVCGPAANGTTYHYPPITE